MSITLAILLLSDHSGRDALLFAAVALLIVAVPVAIVAVFVAVVVGIGRRIRR